MAKERIDGVKETVMLRNLYFAASATKTAIKHRERKLGRAITKEEIQRTITDVTNTTFNGGLPVIPVNRLDKSKRRH